MRRIIFSTGTAVLGLASLMWATTSISAPPHVHAGGGQAPARTGSVHYASRPAPARVAPVRVAPARVAPAVRTGAVRSEHYAGSPSRGGYRNPYRDEYFRHFRPGYRSFLIGDASYYYYDDLPPDFQTVVIDGLTYYLFDGVYYQVYLYGGETIYVVVPTQ